MMPSTALLLSTTLAKSRMVLRFIAFPPLTWISRPLLEGFVVLGFGLFEELFRAVEVRRRFEFEAQCAPLVLLGLEAVDDLVDGEIEVGSCNTRCNFQ